MLDREFRRLPKTSAIEAPAPTAGSQMPRHVAIIMDGNGRWAAARGLARSFGHRAGVEAVRRAVKAAIELGIPYLTIYSFSSENWSRPAEEVADLMGLIKLYIRRDLAELHKAGVRIRVIGERDRVDPELIALIDDGQQLTAANTRLTLLVAFNYGARTEIVRAARRLAERAVAGAISPADIDTAMLSDALDTHDVPDPDLMIRTSGELRLSNFLLWQSAYTELVFLDCHWPDFGRDHLEQAIRQFASRQRRFGGIANVSAG
jgi:undecaprenyl diphosphate synthase